MKNKKTNLEKTKHESSKLAKGSIKAPSHRSERTHREEMKARRPDGQEYSAKGSDVDPDSRSERMDKPRPDQKDSFVAKPQGVVSRGH